MTEAAQRSPNAGRPPGSGTLAVVVPLYNEEEVVREFQARLSAVLGTIAMQSTVLYVNDGSTDRTLETLLELRQADPRIEIIDLEPQLRKGNRAHGRAGPCRCGRRRGH